jgi:hypothetical protein
MVLSPAGKLSFDTVLHRVECPACLAYGELMDTIAAQVNILRESSYMWVQSPSQMV